MNNTSLSFLNANKPRLLIFTIRCSFTDTLNGLSFLYGALMPPRLQYAIQICSPNPVVSTLRLEHIQSLATQVLAGLPHLQYDEKLLFVIYIYTPTINIFLAVG